MYSHSRSSGFQRPHHSVSKLPWLSPYKVIQGLWYVGGHSHLNKQVFQVVYKNHLSIPSVTQVSYLARNVKEKNKGLSPKPWRFQAVSTPYLLHLVLSAHNSKEKQDGNQRQLLYSLPTVPKERKPARVVSPSSARPAPCPRMQHISLLPAAKANEAVPGEPEKLLQAQRLATETPPAGSPLRFGETSPPSAAASSVPLPVTPASPLLAEQEFQRDQNSHRRAAEVC